MDNLFAGLPDRPADEEQVDELLAIGGARIERIVSFGHSTGWFDQDEDEWVAVLTGEGELEFADGSRRVLTVGDSIFLPRHQRHRVVRTAAGGPTIWLAVFVS